MMMQDDGSTLSTLSLDEVAELLFLVSSGTMTAAQAKAEHHRINAERRNGSTIERNGLIDYHSLNVIEGIKIS